MNDDFRISDTTEKSIMSLKKTYRNIGMAYLISGIGYILAGIIFSIYFIIDERGIIISLAYLALMLACGIFSILISKQKKDLSNKSVDIIYKEIINKIDKDLINL